MPTGEGRARQPRGAMRGVTYWVLLFVLAALGAGLAALGESTIRSADRQREVELRFRGEQYARALQAYAAAAPAGAPRFPQELDDLLADTRHEPPRHHLRRRYADPFTGRADWEPLRDAAGRVVGVRSGADRPMAHRLGAATGPRTPNEIRFTAAAPTGDVATPETRRDDP